MFPHLYAANFKTLDFPICNLVNFFSVRRPSVVLGTALDGQILSFPSHFRLNDIQTKTMSFWSFQCPFKSSKTGMTVKWHWNDKLCHSLMSPNLTGGPVARLSGSGHLDRNDRGMTIETTEEWQLKKWKLRCLFWFLGESQSHDGWYACLLNHLKPISLTQSIWFIWHSRINCQHLKFPNAPKIQRSKDPKIQQNPKIRINLLKMSTFVQKLAFFIFV